MRLGEVRACAYACAAIAVSLAASAGAVDAPLPPSNEARPPLPPAPEAQPVPWQHHIEVGGGVAAVETPVSVDGAGKPTPVRFAPAIGFNIDLSWQVFRYLRFTGYLVEHASTLDFPAGSLGLPGTSAITGPSAQTYAFGVRASPTLPLGSRARLWLSAGFGFGHIGYGRFTVSDATNAVYDFTLRERSETFFEVPVGLGASIEIIPRWLSFRIEATGSFLPSQIGDALQQGPVIDGTGKMLNTGPMPKLDASFVQMIGLALHL